MKDNDKPEFLDDSSSSHDIDDQRQVGEPAAGVDRGDMRQQRLMDYRDDSLATANPLEALLGAANADLLEIVYLLKPLLVEALVGEPTLAKLEQITPIFAPYLQATRQVDRLTQLMIKLWDRRSGASQASQDQIMARLGQSEDPVLRYQSPPGGWHADLAVGRDPV